MTLIDDDEVKEIRLDLRERVGFVVLLVSYQLVVKRHVYLKSRINGCALHLGHYLLERTEILCHRLVNEDISVGKVQDLLF